MPGDDARRLLGRLGVWSGELRDAGRLQAREAAAALGITEGAVKVRLHRARALLQRALAPNLKAFAPKPKGLFGRRA